MTGIQVQSALHTRSTPKSIKGGQVIKYIDDGEMIIDRETGQWIPKSENNHFYRVYLKWVADGNQPIPIKPSPAHVLNGDNWELDPAKTNSIELATARSAIRQRQIKLFEMLLAVWEVLRTKGIVVNTDLPADLRAEAAEWKAKLDRINAG